MNGTILFVIAALALTAVVSGLMVWVLLRAQPVDLVASQEQANAAVYRDQLADLDREHAQGALDQAGLQTARDELKRRLLEDTLVAGASPQGVAAAPPARPVLLALTLALLFPLLGMSAYLALGNPQGLNPLVAATKDEERPDMTQLAKMLAQKLEAKPDNAEGWLMLGRTYRSLQRLDESLQAYDKTLALKADDDVLLERVDVVAEKNGSFKGEPWQTIQAVLKRNPTHFSALLLAGSASFTDKQYAAAVSYWQKARAQQPANDPNAGELDNAIAKAKDNLDLANGKAVAPAPTLSGRVSLSAALKAKAKPDDTVFIYATPANGDRMPVAILRATVAQLPMDFVLDDSKSMNPQRKLSQEPRVMLKARVSKTGQAISSKGDLIGVLGPVKLGSDKLVITINEELQ